MIKISVVVQNQIFMTHVSPLRSEVYEQLVTAGVIIPQPEKDPPTVPMDYKWAQELGLIRKPASFMTSICDERGEELLYAGMPISDVFKVRMGCIVSE